MQSHRNCYPRFAELGGGTGCQPDWAVPLFEPTPQILIKDDTHFATRKARGGMPYLSQNPWTILPYDLEVEIFFIATFWPSPFVGTLNPGAEDEEFPHFQFSHTATL